MSLTIKKLRPGRGSNDIRITHEGRQGGGLKHFFITEEALKEIVRWSLFYGKHDAHNALGCNLKEGEEAHVG